MEKLNHNQIANFCYWLTETNDNRGLLDKEGKDIFNGKERISHIENVLIHEFLKKYPDGILTGWTPSTIEKIKSITDKDWKLICNFAEDRKNELFHSKYTYVNGITYNISSGYACVAIVVGHDMKVHVSTRRNGKNNVEGQSEILKILSKYDIENVIFEKGD